MRIEINITVADPEAGIQVNGEAASPEEAVAIRRMGQAFASLLGGKVEVVGPLFRRVVERTDHDRPCPVCHAKAGELCGDITGPFHRVVHKDRS